MAEFSQHAEVSVDSLDLHRVTHRQRRKNYLKNNSDRDIQQLKEENSQMKAMLEKLHSNGPCLGARGVAASEALGGLVAKTSMYLKMLRLIPTDAIRAIIMQSSRTTLPRCEVAKTETVACDKKMKIEVQRCQSIERGSVNL